MQPSASGVRLPSVFEVSAHHHFQHVRCLRPSVRDQHQTYPGHLDLLPKNFGSQGKYRKRSVRKNSPSKQLKSMKPAIRKSESGSTLVITVVVSALIGSVLCSYLVLVSNRTHI